MSKSQKQSLEGRNSPKTHTGKAESHFSAGPMLHSAPDNSTVTVNSANNAPGCLPIPITLDVPSPELSVSLSESWTQVYSSVKKSRTHDCVLETGLEGGVSPGCRECGGTPTRCRRPRLINSASFSGFGTTRMVLHENQNMSGSGREIIDYHNLTPQVPFVPSIAKSIPKKRIFLKKPKKAIKDLFVHKKDSSERPVSPFTLLGGRNEQGVTTKRTKKSSRRRYRARISKEMNDMLSDSSSECCTNVCEDAASLKSFGSQAGCGEIFADEEFFLSLEGTLKCESNSGSSETPKRSPTTAAFQGGKEQMASPTQTEVLHQLGMWETLNKTILIRQNSSLESNTASTPSSGSLSANKTVTPLESPTVSLKTSETKIKELNVDMVTPKSDNQESTSDEGYCDYVSPEDQTKGSLTPVHSRKFPRDTYSGDALYELFYDPNEAQITSIFDKEMDLSPSIFSQSSDLPLSMYSFHVGAEENLAPPLAVDIISPEVLQSNWVGKECLLKLCDTEISLAMDIVNWLKKRNLKGNPIDLGSPKTGRRDNGDVCQQDKVLSAEIGNIPTGTVLKSAYNIKDMPDFTVKDTRLVDSHHSMDTPKHHKEFVSNVTLPDSQPRSPTSHMCFRIFNINSPLTPSRDLPSPVALSPGSGTSSLFVLAINKESLCEPCKGSLKHGAKELHLCHSCTAFIERIKASEFWADANLHQSKMTGTPLCLRGGLLPSPSSSYGIASDISILSLVEQCATQVSSLRISAYQRLSDNETRAITEPGKDAQPKKDQSQKYLKSKHKKKIKTAATVGRHFGSNTYVKNNCKRAVHSSSLLEGQDLGLVTTNDSEEYALKTSKSQCYLKMNPLNDVGLTQASRPTSLPLINATYCEFSSKQPHSVMKIKEKPHERSHRPKKPMVNHEGILDNIFPEEEKVERKCRMKK